MDLALALTMLGWMLLYMLLAWLWSRWTDDTSVVDWFWGLGFIWASIGWLWLAGPAGGLTGPGAARTWLVFGMVVAWGLRLALYLRARNARIGEDPRYAAMRAAHPDTWWWRSLLTVFFLQGMVLWIIWWPVATAMGPTAGDVPPLGWLDGLGFVVWAAGMGLEVAADAQLARFKRLEGAEGRLYTGGVWAWSQHPNYAGEAILWWGIGLLAVAAQGWWGVLSLVGPLGVTLLLMYVSGRPLTSKAQSVKPGWLAWASHTSEFWPMPPKRVS